MTAWLIGPWIALLAAVIAILLLGREYRYQPMGELRVSKSGNRLSAQWLSEEGELENEQPVNADYVALG
ncbi:hypothetical protein ACM25P_02110 [Vreelandella alkaliphila]|uniref:hypothetical protein n=1 Tax=Vreelandella alkaliphila TaxID=272774 RepID=UPI0039F59B3C